jgi:hypothetical protein
MLGHAKVFDYGWSLFLTAVEEAVSACPKEEQQ